MPVFHLALQFDNQGAVTAIRQLGKVSDAADDAQSELQLVTTQARQTGASLDSLASKAKKLAGALTLGLGLRELNQLRKNLTLAASDAEETANKFNVVFGSVKEQADQAAESLALNYGMSRQGAQAVLSQTGDLLTGLGLGADKALSLAEQVAQLGTDLASFSNYAGGAEGAIDALTKALLGETEQAKMLGVVLGETQMEQYAKSVGKTWGQLDLAEKAQLRLNAAIKQSPNAVGDFARSMGSYANQARVADAILKDFITSIGQGLLPATTQAIASINSNRVAIDELGQSLGAGLGNALDAVVQNFEAITEAVKLAAVAYGTYTAAQRVLTSEFIKGVKAGAQEELAAYRASQATRQATIENARAAQESAAARLRETELTLANIRAKQDHIVSQRQVVRNAALETRAIRELAAAQTALIQANNALAAAEGRSSVAIGTKAGAATKAAGAAATVAGTAFRGLGAGVKGLVALMGGPWVAGITLASTALFALANKQSLAEQGAALHQKALQSLEISFHKTAEGAWEFAEANLEAARANLSAAIDRQTESVRKFGAELKLVDFSALTGFSPAFREDAEALDALIEDAYLGKAAWSDVDTTIIKLVNRLNDAGKGGSRLAQTLKANLDISRQVREGEENLRQLAGTQEKLKAQIEQTGKAATNTATQLDSLNAALNLLNQAGANAPNNAQTAIEWLQKRTAASKSAKEAAEKEAKAYDLIAMALLSMSAAQEMALGHQGEARKFFAAIEEFQGRLGEVYTQQGTKGTSSINTAREAFQRLREEVDQLNGTSLAGTSELAKKLQEIGEQGKKAGESAASIDKLKNAYMEAFNAKRVREFSDALRDVNAEIASLSGDTATERLLENSRRMEAAIAQLYGNLAMPTPEASGDAAAAQWGTLTKQLAEAGTAITNLGAGLAKSNQTKDLQTTIDLYRELRELNGQYTLGVAEQNRLIELQGQLYRNNGIPDHLVREWELLQKLQSDTTGWGGVRRAAKVYYADSMNWGKQFENLTTNTFSLIGDGFNSLIWEADFSFNSILKSFGQMLTQMLIQAAQANIANALFGGNSKSGGWGDIFGKVVSVGVGALAGSFSGGSGGIASAAKGSSYKNASALGNVFASGLEPWTNSVVDQPTFFDASHHLREFARGGVFGEAGPEAVMPLARMSGGRLGVEASFGGIKGFRNLTEAMNWNPGKDVEKRFLENMQLSMRMMEENRQRIARERAQAATPKVTVVINNNASGVEVSQEQRQNSDGSIDIELMIDQIVSRKMAQRGSATNNFMRKGLGIKLPPIGR